MSDLTAKFTTLEGQLSDQAEETHSQLVSMETTLENIQSAIDAINSTLLLQQRQSLLLIAANSPCAPCPTPSLIVTPPTDTTVTINSDKCKRAQAFIHYMQVVFTVLDSASAFSVPFTPSLITDAISQVIVAVENGDDTPVISWPEAMQLVGDLINYVAGNFFVGGTLSSYFSSLIPDMIPAIFAATSASSAKSEYDGIVDSSDLPDYVKPVIKDAAYAAIYSYYFDEGSSPNLTGYSGSACFGSSCYTVSAVDTVIGGSTHRMAVTWPDIFSPVDHIGGLTSSEPTWATLDLIGWKIKPTALVDFFTDDSGSSTGLNANTVHTFTSSTTFVAILRTDSTPFTVQVCPPGIDPS